LIKAKGFALVLVLWVLSLLIIMAGSFALTMRREAAIVAGSSNNAKAIAVAESGLAIAELMLLNPDPLKRWRSDGSIYQIDYENLSVRVRLLSEAGKIDLNSADQTLLQGMMTFAPIDAELQTQLVNAILDWRDTDDLVRLDGAEKSEYKKAGLSYRPRNKPFQSVEELQLVLGMNEEIFIWLESRVTVYSGQAQVDLTKASKEVLQVLPNMDVGLLEQYLAARRQSVIDGLPPPPSIQPGTGAMAGSNQGLLSGQQSGIGTIPSNGTEQTGATTVVSEARFDDGTTANIKVLIKKSNTTESSPFQILKWQLSTTSDGSLFAEANDELLVGQYAEPEFNN
jgi:general secretion pathway protein K